MSPVNRCSCVTTWLNLFSPTPRLAWGRQNEVPQDGRRAGWSLGTKISSGCRGPFRPCRDYVKGYNVRRLPVGCVRVAYVDWRKSVCVVCIRFPLHGVHQFESLWLSNMSNHLSYGCHQVVNYFGMVVYVGIMNLCGSGEERRAGS
jgi:hypothetical protein